jgi:hypothetical protein
VNDAFPLVAITCGFDAIVRLITIRFDLHFPNHVVPDATRWAEFDPLTDSKLEADLLAGPPVAKGPDKLRGLRAKSIDDFNNLSGFFLNDDGFIIHIGINVSCRNVIFCWHRIISDAFCGQYDADFDIPFVPVGMSISSLTNSIFVKPMLVINAEDSAYGPGRRSNSSADDSADRTGGSPAFMRTLGSSSNRTLAECGARDEQSRK